MDSNSAKILSCSLRTGIKTDTNCLYGLLICGNFGFDIKLNSVTVNRNTIKMNVIKMAMITVQYLFRFAAALMPCNAAGKPVVNH